MSQESPTNEIVTLFPIMHRRAEQILMRCSSGGTAIFKARQLPGAKWSNTYKAWYVALNQENYERIRRCFNGCARLYTEHLKAHLLKKRAVEATAIPEVEEVANTEASKEEVSLPVPVPAEPAVAYRISMENLKHLQRAVETLVLRAYSKSTIRTYRGELMVFFQALGTIAADRLGTDDVKRYLLKCHREGLKENTLHSRINALKFYYEHVLHYEKFFLEIPRPKKPFLLPRILGEEELTRLFNALTNKKHKPYYLLLTVQVCG